MTRKCVSGDIPALLDLIAAHLKENGERLDETDRERVASELAQCVDSTWHELFVSCGPEGRILGYVHVHWISFPLRKGCEAYVTELLVDARIRSSGVGSKLLACVEAEAVRRGCVRIMLNNPMDSESYKRQFYAKRGYFERVNFANFVKPLN